MKKNYTKTQNILVKTLDIHFNIKNTLTTIMLCFVLIVQAQFTEQTGTNNPFDGIDVGTWSSPICVDLDNDSDLDIVSGNEDGIYLYYINNGSNSFTLQDAANNPFDGIDSGSFSIPTFTDVDSDGDMDLVIGKASGSSFNYFQNDGNNNFTGQGGTNSPFTGLVAGQNTAPEFADIDNDGDMDLISGNSSGTFPLYLNNGSGVFIEQQGASNPLFGIDVGTFSKPRLVDLDNDGDLDLVSGIVDGTLNYYTNDGNNVFTEQTGVDNPFDGIDAGSYSTPTFADLDNDGDLDLISGNSNGFFKYYINDGTLSNNTIDMDNSQLSIYPNPATTVLNLELQTTLKQVNIYNLQGQNIIHSSINQINVLKLPNGIYIAKIEDENGSVSTKRFIKN